MNFSRFLFVLSLALFGLLFIDIFCKFMIEYGGFIFESHRSNNLLYGDGDDGQKMCKRMKASISLINIYFINLNYLFIDMCSNDVFFVYNFVVNSLFGIASAFLPWSVFQGSSQFSSFIQAGT